MRKMITVLLASTALLAGHAALAADATYKAETTVDKNDDGSFKRDTTVESKDATGKTGTEVSVDHNVNSDGTAKTTSTVEKTRDPKGLFNKQTDKVERTTKTSKNGTTSTEVKHKVNGDTVSDTKAKDGTVTNTMSNSY